MEIAGRLMAFNDESDDEVFNEPLPVKFTELRDDGTVELAFNYGTERLYLAVPLDGIMRAIAKEYGSET